MAVPSEKKCWKSLLAKTNEIKENIHCEAIFSESSGINDEEPNTKQPLSLYLVFSNDKLK